MIEELRPATALVNSSRRCSTPCARRSSQPARRLSAPVRSRPAPRIIVAMMLITALPEKPSNSSSGSTRPGQAQQHQHDQRDDVGADALEQEHHHREAHQPEHELHVGGERQRGVHAGSLASASSCQRGRRAGPTRRGRVSGRGSRNGSAVATAAAARCRADRRGCSGRASHRARPTSARHSPASRWRGASARRPRACATSSAANSGCTRRRLLWRFLCQGSGK